MRARALRISRSVVRSSSEQNIPLAVSRSWALSLSVCSFLAMLHLAQLSCSGRRLPSLGNKSKQKTGPHRKSPALFGPKRQAGRGSCGMMLPCHAHTAQAAAAPASESCAPNCGGYAIRIRGWVMRAMMVRHRRARNH
jgi:hypothetical protein